MFHTFGCDYHTKPGFLLKDREHLAAIKGLLNTVEGCWVQNLDGLVRSSLKVTNICLFWNCTHHPWSDVHQSCDNSSICIWCSQYQDQCSFKAGAVTSHGWIATTRRGPPVFDAKHKCDMSLICIEIINVGITLHHTGVRAVMEEKIHTIQQSGLGHVCVTYRSHRNGVWEIPRYLTVWTRTLTCNLLYRYRARSHRNKVWQNHTQDHTIQQFGLRHLHVTHFITIGVREKKYERVRPSNNQGWGKYMW